MGAVLRLVIVALLAVAGLQSTPANAGVEADMEVGIDRMYGDFTNFDLPSGDPAECRWACANDGRCVAWTFVKPGVQGPSARCWLKNEVRPAAVNHCCISGLRAGGSQGPAGVLTVIEATYGASCGVPRGNVTGQIAGQCNGRAGCDYRVDVGVLGDPAPGCAKDYRVTYSCGAAAKEVFLGAEAGHGGVAELRCP